MNDNKNKELEESVKKLKKEIAAFLIEYIDSSEKEIRIDTVLNSLLNISYALICEIKNGNIDDIRDFADNVKSFIIDYGVLHEKN